MINETASGDNPRCRFVLKEVFEVKERERLQNKRMVGGMSLLEVTISVIIVAILAGLALPKMNTVLEKGRAQEAENILRALMAAQLRFEMILDDGRYATTMNLLDIEIDGNLSYFENIQLFDDQNRVATIQNSNNGYKLGININGDIACGVNQDWCNKLGLPYDLLIL